MGMDTEALALARQRLAQNLPERLIWGFESVGFARNLYLRDFGMADMGAGAPYTHRLAMNLWAGRGARPAPADSARLLGYRLQPLDAATFASAQTRLSEDGRTGDLIGTDPAGVTLRLERAWHA